MLELFVIQSEFFFSPKGQPNKAATYLHDMMSEALETSHLRSVLRNRFCRGEKGELRKGKVSNRRATEQGEPCTRWHRVARGPWLLKSTELLTLPC